MGIALVRLPAYEVNLFIYTGRIDHDEGLRLYSELDLDDPANAPRWLTYIDKDADFSGIPVTAFPEAKHVLTPILKRLSKRPGYCSAAICSSIHCEFILSFWRAYVEHDPDYISHPAFFRNLEDACDWLQLPDAGCEAIAEAIRTQQAQAPQSSRPERAGGGPRPPLFESADNADPADDHSTAEKHERGAERDDDF